MDYTTELMNDGDDVHVATADPNVLSQLEQHPAAVLIEREGAHAKFSMPLRDFELHVPSGT